MSDSGMDLWPAIVDELDACEKCVEDMAELGRNAAEAERAYRVAKHKRIASERAYRNTPVTIIDDVVKGYEDIARLALERDEARVLYDANREAALLHKKRADIYREQYAREWSQAGERL